MEVALDKLEKQLEKQLGKHLEKFESFFSKRRRSSGRSLFASVGETPSPLSLEAMSDAIFRTFPQPSFIRPTSTRMLAREEVSPTTHRPDKRSQSLPEPPMTPPPTCHISLGECERRTSSSPGQPPRIPKRSSSLSPARRPASLASLGELLEFSFANSSRQRTASNPLLESRSRAGSVSPKAQPDRKRHPDGLQHTLAGHRREDPITPPRSAEYNKTFDSTRSEFQKGLPPTPPNWELTPEPSPKFSPFLRYQPDNKPIAKPPRPRSLALSANAFREPKESLRQSASCSSLGGSRLALAPNHQSQGKTSDNGAKPRDKRPKTRQLPRPREPSVSEFLSLSDDDVAGDALAPLARLPGPPKPPSCALPLDPPGWFLSPQVSPGSRLLTLSPPLATRPATEAAFEAAKIAARYKFDLVYVVNLWPTRLASTPSSAGAELSSPTSNTSRVEMTGRILAGYGLQWIKSPFQISESVHLKVLRSSGWLEFHSDNPMPEEFSQGYSCSFYTNHNLGRRSKLTDKGTLEGNLRAQRGSAPNTGIAFAAYRLPRADGRDLRSDEVELAALRTDAENLVNMLIDTPVTGRQRRPVASPPVSYLPVVVKGAGR